MHEDVEENKAVLKISLRNIETAGKEIKDRLSVLIRKTTEKYIPHLAAEVGSFEFE